MKRAEYGVTIFVFTNNEQSGNDRCTAICFQGDILLFSHATEIPTTQYTCELHNNPIHPFILPHKAKLSFTWYEDKEKHVNYCQATVTHKFIV